MNNLLWFIGVIEKMNKMLWGRGYGFNSWLLTSLNIGIHWVLIILLDSSHCANQLWYAGHVLNLNIKKVTDPLFWHFGVLGQIFDLEISTSIAKRLRRLAPEWKITCSNPTNHQEKKKIFLPDMGVYIWGYIY